MLDYAQYTVESTATIKEAIKLIDRNTLRMAIVLDKDKKVVGVVTDGDIRRCILHAIPLTDAIERIMNKNPLLVRPETTNRDIMYWLKVEKAHGLPVVDDQQFLMDIILPETYNFTSLLSTKSEPKLIHKILVIGGAGYIGSVLVRQLLAENYKVKVLDRFLYGKESLQELQDPNLEIIEGDTRHVETLSECIQDVEAVIHLAELVGDPACAIDPKITLDNNYLATSLVASVCKHYQVNRFIYISSCSVYGASEGQQLLNENSTLNPLSLYAKMKIQAERVLLSMEDENFSPTILRLGTVYGWSFRPRFDLVINLLTAKALHEGKITLFGGEQWRPFIHVSDVSKAIRLVLRSSLEKIKGKTFNVGENHKNYQIKEIGHIIQSLIPSAKVVMTEGQVTDNRDYKVDFSKINRELGFTADHGIEEGVKEMISVLQQKPINYKNQIYNNVIHLQENIQKF